MSYKGRKILFICTEDWFFRSHFLPLSDATSSVTGYETAVVCGVGQARAELEQRGLKIIPVEFSRSSNSLFPTLKLTWHLIKTLRRENPDIIHMISLKPIMLGGLVSRVVPWAACVYHLTGLGFLGVSESKKHHWLRKILIFLITFYLKRRRSWLVVENPDDLDALRQLGKVPKERTSIFGGAGVDPEKFPLLPEPGNKIPIAGYVGRMVWSKGVDVLISAMDRLAEDNASVNLDLYGIPDEGNPNAVSRAELELWNQRDDTIWHGLSNDVREVWAKADFAVMPSRGGEGLPRSLLEAASCAKALIVTDVPGCRHFVRDGVEGYIVPPGDAQALASAMKKLANDPGLRKRMGKAARERVIEGFSESHVRAKVLDVYNTLLR